MITIPLSKLFIGYVKNVTFKEVKTYIENMLNLKSEVTTSQHCYGDLDDYSWETFKFYFKDIDTLFSINAGVDRGRNKENKDKDVIFIEINIYQKDDYRTNIYVETDDVEHWLVMSDNFYQKLAKYCNRNFNN